MAFRRAYSEISGRHALWRCVHAGNGRVWGSRCSELAERNLHQDAKHHATRPPPQVFLGFQSCDDFVLHREVESSCPSRRFQIGVEHFTQSELHLFEAGEFKLELFALAFSPEVLAFANSLLHAVEVGTSGGVPHDVQLGEDELELAEVQLAVRPGFACDPVL